MNEDFEAPLGTRVLKPGSACRKLDRGKTWLWDRVKNDPDFPKPIYLAPRAPVFLEKELDAYLQKCADRSRAAVVDNIGADGLGRERARDVATVPAAARKASTTSAARKLKRSNGAKARPR